MAVEDKYVVSGNVLGENFNGGGSLRKSIISFEVDSADSDGSLYRLMSLTGNTIITNVLIGNDAITSGTDYDLGFYDKDGGAVVVANVLLDAGNLSGAHVSGSELSGMSNVDVANRGKQIYELLSKTQLTKAESYDLCLLANTVGSATGTVTVIVDYIVV